ncbi:hypothetical protein CI105_08175 [Candidatus Izimaplasma bacterium ZiA1]|uniref:hypothetical protein n=1 Tax=Candidatus Izimoplasma sp. ZiA1 TaxID=2024899 RepID=UPI000BAA4327|nr:hypothetical protein CI105_08175 [Candidatus Izimaplasma bacterium ZiA1]
MSKSISSDILDNRVSRIIAVQTALVLSKNALVSSSIYILKYNNLLNILILSILVMIYLMFFIKNIRAIKFSIVSFLLVFFIAISILLSFFRYDVFQYSYFVDDFQDFLLYSLPILFIIPIIKDMSILIKWFYKSSYYIFFFVILSAFIFLFSRDVGYASEYSMSFGKTAIVPTIFFISKWFKDHKMIDLLIVLILLVTIIVFASRFPILIIGVFLVIKFVFGSGKERWLKIFIIIFFGLIILMFLKDIAINFNNFLSLFDIDSRTLRYIINNNLTYDSGRELIHSSLTGYINNKPVFGYGIGSSYVLLDNGLAHGFYYDVISSFGYVFGFLFLFIFSIITIISFIKTSSRYTKELILIFGVRFLPIITIQGSLLASAEFWIIIAITIQVLARVKFRVMK